MNRLLLTHGHFARKAAVFDGQLQVASLRRARLPTCVLLALLFAACSAPPQDSVDGGSEPDAIEDRDATANIDGSHPTDARDDSGYPDGGGCDSMPPNPENPDLVALCGAVPATLDDWETCYLERFCEWEVNCSPQNGYRSVDECVELSYAVSGGRLAAERRERQRAFEQGKATIDEDSFARCLVERSTDRCYTALHHPACATRFIGTVEDGAACTGDIECASPGATCARDCQDACCEGVCEPAAKEGEYCRTNIEPCEPGLRCTASQCVNGDIGSPCNTSLGCDRTGWCDNDCGVCTPTLDEGAECDSVLQCGGKTSCVGLSIVSSEPGACLRISEAGDPCDNLCLGNLICSAAPNATGSCVSLPELGQSCGSLTPCLGQTIECRDGTCVERAEVGDSCATAGCMPGLFCTSDLGDANPVCERAQPVGAPCTGPHQCESYLCSGDEDQEGSCLPWLETCPE